MPQSDTIRTPAPWDRKIPLRVSARRPQTLLQSIRAKPRMYRIDPLKLGTFLAAMALLLLVPFGSVVAQNDDSEEPARQAEEAPTAGLPDNLPEGDLEEQSTEPAESDEEAPPPNAEAIGNDAPATESAESTSEPADATSAAAEVPVETSLLPPGTGPPPFRFESPFSLPDCITILRAIIAGIRVEDGAAFTRFEPASLRRGIEVVSNYLRARDDLHYNLVDYRWERVGTDSVTSALIQQLRFTWEDSSMPTRVDALSLEALRGDVYLHSMMIYDDQGELAADYKFDDTRLMRLRHSLPRREVFHLWSPTAISRVDLALSRFDPLESVFPQVNLHVGRTNRPEHGKATIYYLSRAEQRFTAEDLAGVRQELQHALAEMIAYNEALRRRR